MRNKKYTQVKVYKTETRKPRNEKVAVAVALHYYCYNLSLMAVVVFMLLLLAMAGHSSATWCVCKEGSDATLQKTLDYACGAGADCNPIHSNGQCYNPNSVRAHCSYAVNSYFQRNRQAPLACDFAGTASIVTSDPSTTGCMYPATASSTTTPGSTTPTTTGGTTSTTGGSPFVTTPSTGGVLGGTNNGLGPSGMNNDISDGGILFHKSIFSFSSIILTISGLVFWWA
ncbi:hypothetical protein BUALT_Bualt07G0069700 [Buddleja alternifolia]|uniref:X8 domain-containing protein n=1 Tax=Buddleja alternifolia TaxID=168488 RepID=A0AAV6X826_9LAMI|nr:hypothetical protein BUALT_Bualt07G0069700 [Buddleja alternifolia]